MDKKKKKIGRRAFFKTVVTSVAALTLGPNILNAKKFKSDSIQVWSCGGLAEALNTANALYEKKTGIKIYYTGAFAHAIGQKIYRWVKYKNKIYRGLKGAEILIERQKEAIKEIKSKGFILKINTVVIPGINDGHIEEIAYEMAEMNADIMNCIPIIPVINTSFENICEPDENTMNYIREIAAQYIPQMYHCKRCRADAVGFLDFNKCTS